MKPNLLPILFLITTFVTLNHGFEYFECDESKGNGFQPTDCVITGVHLRSDSMEKYVFSPKALMTSVRFVDSELNYLPREMFQNLPMKNLIVEGVGLKEITPYTFRMATELRELHAANNHVTKLIRNAFYGAESIRLIDLSNNRLGYVDSDAFSNMTSLRWLSLANNDLRKLDPQWFVYSNAFMHINLRYNKFGSVEMDFSDKISLTDLDISGKQGVGSPMKELAIHMNCTYLTNLDVSHNTNLQKLTVTCRTRSLLNTRVYAHDTSLGVGDQPALVIDPLLNTHVLTLDNTLYFNAKELASFATSLRQLSLDHNSNKKLNGALVNLTDLHKLSLRDSGVDIASINEMKNLRVLNLAENGLASLDIKRFDRLEFLRELNLSGNRLTMLAVNDVLNKFPLLEYLDITDNRFSNDALHDITEALANAGVVVNF